MSRVLVCEDEEAIRDFVVINLKRAGYETQDVGSGEEALEVFYSRRQSFDVVILDIMMPGIDGYTVCEKLRETSNVGIIMLTAKTQDDDKVRGLKTGADDYVTKPFSPSELVARVDAVCRRVNSVVREKPISIISGGFELRPKSRMLFKDGAAVDITQIECQIIEYLMEHKNYGMSRKEILSAVWGNEYDGDEKIVDVNVRRIRMKIEDDPSLPKYIQTVWGYGYKWTE